MIAIKSERSWLALAVLAFAVLIYRHVYVDVLGEEDLARVAAGILYAAKNGFDTAQDMHYGLSFSYGYYWFIYTFLPKAMYTNADALIRFINYSGFLSSMAVMAAAGLLLSRVYSTLSALIAVILFGFSPMFMELSTSGHQILPAAALLLIAGNVMLSADESRSSITRAVLSIIACALIFMSLSMRAETALALPWLVVVTADPGSQRNKWGRHALRVGVAVFAFMIFIYFQSAFLGSQKSTASALQGHLSAFYHAGKMAKGIIIFTIAFGLVSTIVALAAPFLKFSAARKYVLHASLLILPTLILWLPTPQPSRHFFFAFFGLSILVGTVLPLVVRNRSRAVLAALAVVAANQLVIELLYPAVVSRYEWNYPKIGERRSTFHVPLGFFPLNHRANEQMFTALKNEGQQIAAMTDPHVIVFGDQLQYILIALLDSNDKVTIRRDTDYGDSYIVMRDDQQFHLITKYLNWPDDTLATYLATHDVGSAKVYEQPYTISKYDVSPHHIPVNAVQKR